MGWKIVRDNQPEAARKHGISGSWRTSSDPVAALTKKLFEEAGEFAEQHDPGELYDLWDVVNELIRLTDPTGDHEVDHARKVNRLGRFRSHVEWSPVPEPCDRIGGCLAEIGCNCKCGRKPK